MSIFDITPEPLDGETPYFKGSERPGFPGVYKRIYYTADGWGKPSFCRWDGEQWFTGAHDIANVYDEPMMVSHYQPGIRDGFDFAWCGLMPIEAADAEFADEPAEEGSVDDFFAE